MSPPKVKALIIPLTVRLLVIVAESDIVRESDKDALLRSKLPLMSQEADEKISLADISTKNRLSPT